jgi:hypothetical protein
MSLQPDTLAPQRLSSHAVLGAGLVLISMAACTAAAIVTASGRLPAAAVIIILPAGRAWASTP